MVFAVASQTQSERLEFGSGLETMQIWALLLRGRNGQLHENATGSPHQIADKDLLKIAELMLEGRTPLFHRPRAYQAWPSSESSKVVVRSWQLAAWASRAPIQVRGPPLRLMQVAAQMTV